MRMAFRHLRIGAPGVLPRAFVHPLWWSALALLLLNDHVLKTAHVLPGALTGKLSDVAGMLVAPPLLALLIGAQRKAARWIAPAAVGLTLCAIKLAPSAAHALEAALTAIGVPSRIWVDASDLWALCALPIGGWLCTPHAAARALRRRARAHRFVHRGGVALAALACLGTSAGGSDKKHRSDAPSLRNATDRRLALVVTSTEGAGDCRIYRDDRIGILTEDAFQAPREITLDPDDDVALVDDEDTAECGAASIAFDDGTRKLVYWRDLDEIESFVPDDDDKRLARRMTVTRKNDAFRFALGDDLHAFELGDEDAPEPTCKYADDADSLEFTPLAVGQGFLEVAEVRTDDDGCIEVDWFMGEGDVQPDTQRLCIPSWAFPFEEGETLAVAQAATDDGARTLRITRYATGKPETQLALWNDAASFEDSRIKKLAAVDCVGRLTSCGAYVRPLAVTLRGKDGSVSSGEDASFDGKDPKSVRVLIGDARDVGWTAATCTGPEAELGPTANALELREY
jgi:hypothetical protein